MKNRTELSFKKFQKVQLEKEAMNQLQGGSATGTDSIIVLIQP